MFTMKLSKDNLLENDFLGVLLDLNHESAAFKVLYLNQLGDYPYLIEHIFNNMFNAEFISTNKVKYAMRQIKFEKPNMILLDARKINQEMKTLIKKINNDPDTQRIPLIGIHGKQDLAKVSGPEEVVFKPLSADNLE
ncbi:MAG: hypothetical protein R3240_04330 [Gammaproteobacteria bacterium]|nr:hypothetical protein [Gammaproteobacteria bacterium]